MSMPRRAMKDMGLQACCLWCDEPDEAGSSRCHKCIEFHSRIREEIAKAPPDDPFYQFAKELIAMAVAPHRYDNDPIHGPWLEEQQRRAGQYIPKGKEKTEQDVLEIFENQKKIEKKNIIQNIANKNEWKDKPPEPELARKIGNEAWKQDDIDITEYHAGRTIPSKIIDPIDRSDRIGEDDKMVTRTNIKAKNEDLDEEILEILENEELHQKKVKKDAWDSTVSDVLDLLDNED
ncbi:MAG: hypothetical protein CMA97_02225 [Euryarchaeota archaeon]|nr:hypothetical protein [Euryarchaeota archaeon]